MRNVCLATGILVALALCAQAFGQSTYATVSGTVADPSGALLPGVSLTATNNATGVVTTVVSNESGAYNLTAFCRVPIRYRRNCPVFKKKPTPTSRSEMRNRSG